MKGGKAINEIHLIPDLRNIWSHFYKVFFLCVSAQPPDQ